MCEKVRLGMGGGFSAYEKYLKRGGIYLRSGGETRTGGREINSKKIKIRSLDRQWKRITKELTRGPYEKARKEENRPRTRKMNGPLKSPGWGRGRKVDRRKKEARFIVFRGERNVSFCQKTCWRVLKNF